jgi:hypothetical protein
MVLSRPTCQVPRQDSTDPFDLQQDLLQQLHRLPCRPQPYNLIGLGACDGSDAMDEVDDGRAAFLRLGTGRARIC